MNDEQRLPTYAELAALVEVQTETIEALRAEVAGLKARLGMDSRNSSKSPSSEGLGKPVAPQSLRRKSGRKPDGQAGHKGETLCQVAVPDRVVEHRPAECDGCGVDLVGARLRGLGDSGHCIVEPVLRVWSYDRASSNASRTSIGGR